MESQNLIMGLFFVIHTISIASCQRIILPNVNFYFNPLNLLSNLLYFQPIMRHSIDISRDVEG